jgi:hypothetical protein
MIAGILRGAEAPLFHGTEAFVSRCGTARKNRTARKHVDWIYKASINKACGPPGGLVGIDQEVVTLRGLYGNSRVWD